MMQKWWFKLFIWICATAFFFSAAAVIISILNPGPNESQVSGFMGGMMGAMHGGTMGYSATIEEDELIQSIISIVSDLSIPLILSFILLAFNIRLWRRNYEKR